MKTLYITVSILLILGLCVINGSIPFIISRHNLNLTLYFLWCSLSGAVLGSSLGVLGRSIFRDRTQVGDFYANSR